MTAFVDEAVAVATVPDTNIRTEWVLVTPEMATEWLANNTHNRNIRRQHLYKLIRDMANDNYMITHQGIAISDTNVLIDGQHRLTAIIESKKPQWLLVTTGLPMKAQEEVDGTARRHAGDLGLIKESGYGSAKAAATRLLLTIEDLGHVISPSDIARVNGQWTTADIQKAYAERYGVQMERMINLVQTAAQRTKGRIGASSLLAAAVYYPDRAEDFLKGIIDNGVGLSDNDPRMALLKWRGPGKVIVPQATFAALKAARYFNYGIPVSVIRLRYDEQMRLTKAPEDPTNKPWGGKKATNDHA